MIARHNSYLLLGSLLLMIVFTPIFESIPIGRNVMDVVFCAVTVAVVLARDVMASVVSMGLTNLDDSTLVLTKRSLTSSR